jgi:Uma2 family endonuclease
MNVASAQVETSVRRFRPDTPMSDEEFLRFSKEMEPMRCERDASGEIILMSPNWSETSSKNSYLNYQLMKWAEETDSGKTFDSSGGFTLADGSLRSPDAAWVSWRRWNALSEKERHGFARICPQFLIELRSESDRLLDATEKMRIWMESGAEVAWLVDPQEKTVTIYRAGQEPERLVDPTSVQGDGPVAGFGLVMARVWG